MSLPGNVCFSYPCPSVITFLFLFLCRTPYNEPLLLLTTESMAEQLIHTDSLMSIFIPMTLRSTPLITMCLLSFSLAFSSLCWHLLLNVSVQILIQSDRNWTPDLFSFLNSVSSVSTLIFPVIPNWKCNGHGWWHPTFNILANSWWLGWQRYEDNEDLRYSL